MMSTEPTAGNQEHGGPWISVVSELQRRWYLVRNRIRQPSGQSLFFTFLSFASLINSIAL